MNRAERGDRARRAAARRDAVRAPSRQPEPEAYRVLIAVHRPRFRSRAERAVALPQWETRSLLNREDPIGLINQKPPDLLIISDDFGRNRNLGYIRAAQRWRESGMRLIGLFETPEEAHAAAEFCDTALAPPWRTADLRALAARFYTEQRGVEPTLPAAPDEAETTDEGA